MAQGSCGWGGGGGGLSALLLEKLSQGGSIKCINGGHRGRRQSFRTGLTRRQFHIEKK